MRTPSLCLLALAGLQATACAASSEPDATVVRSTPAGAVEPLAEPPDPDRDRTIDPPEPDRDLTPEELAECEALVAKYGTTLEPRGEDPCAKYAKYAKYTAKYAKYVSEARAKY